METSSRRRRGSDVDFPQRYVKATLAPADVWPRPRVCPRYISVIIKSKVLRLKLPSEVRASDAKAKRSKASGHLVITCPKVSDTGMAMFLKPKAKAAAEARLQRLDGNAAPTGAVNKLHCLRACSFSGWLPHRRPRPSRRRTRRRSP